MRFLATVFMALLLLPAAQAQPVDDQTITSRVNSVIENNEDLASADVLVVTVNGYVLMAGQALSAQQKQDISTAVAFASTGIRRLINELEVVDALDFSHEPGDRLILEQIVAVVPALSPDTLPVIHNGTVHLLGRVTREEGTEVAEAISSMQGVQNIRLSYEYIQ